MMGHLHLDLNDVTHCQCRNCIFICKGFVLKVANFLKLTILVLLVSCGTKESTDIPDQSTIYGHYQVSVKKGSSLARGKATFYENGKTFFSSYVALRGTSFITFEGLRMTEVRNMFNRTHYENTIDNHITIDSTKIFEYRYENNDGKILNLEIPLPSFVTTIRPSVNIERRRNKVLFKVDWEFDSINHYQSKSRVYLTLFNQKSEYFPNLTGQKPIKFEMEAYEFDKFDSFQVCTKLEIESTRSSIVCDQKIYL